MSSAGTLIDKYPLEGDGFISHIYHYLWTKDDLARGPLGVRIPDTVVFRFRMPVAWFFTSRDGTIKRKARQTVTLEQILDAFLVKSAKRSGCDIVATFVDTSSGGGTVGSGPLQSAESGSGGAPTAAAGGGAGGSRPTITYMNEDSLRSFLGNSRRPYSGVLQLFIGPKSPYNTVMRCVWAPKLCVSERRVNTRKLKDRRAGIFERAVTFEGEPHNSDSAAVRGSVLPKQLQGLSESIVFHVAQVSRLKARVSRLVADFKLDGDDKMWLLRVVSLRLEGETEDRSDPAVLSGKAVDTGRSSGVGGFGARARGVGGLEAGADDGVIFPHRQRSDGMMHPLEAAMSGLKKPRSLLGPVSLDGGMRVPATALPSLNGVSSVLAPGMQAMGSVLGPPLVPEGEEDGPGGAGAGPAGAAAGGGGGEADDGSLTGQDPFRVQSSTLRGVRPQSRQSLLASQITLDGGAEDGFNPGAVGLGPTGQVSTQGGRRTRSGSLPGGLGGKPPAEHAYLRPAVEVPELTPAKMRLMRKAHALEARRQKQDPESTMPASLMGAEAAHLAQTHHSATERIQKSRAKQRESHLQRTRDWVDGEMGLTGATAARSHASAGVLEAAARHVTEALPEAALQASNGMLVLREGQCPSCGAAMSQAMATAGGGAREGDAGGCPVPYKTIISHYDAVLGELGLRGITSHEMEDYDHDVRLVTAGSIEPQQAFDTLPVDMVLWPEQGLSKAAAGGVGVYGVWSGVEYLRAAALSQEAKRKKRQMENRRKARRAEERVRQRRLEREQAGLDPDGSDEEEEADEGLEEGEDGGLGETKKSQDEEDGLARIDIQPDATAGFISDADEELSLAAIGEGGRLGRPPVNELPPILRLLHPRMGPAEYRWMRSDPLFMFRTARVCEACFLVYAQFSQNTVSGRAPHFALRQIMGPKVRKMVDQRDATEALEDGRRLAIEDGDREEEEDRARKAKGRPVFRVGPSGSELSFHSSQRKEEEAKQQGDSQVMPPAGRETTQPVPAGARGARGARAKGRRRSSAGGKTSPVAAGGRSGRTSRATNGRGSPEAAPGPPEDGFRQYLGEQGFSQTGPGLPPSLRVGGGSGGSVVMAPRSVGASMGSSGSFMKAVAADPELHSGHPLAFMSATGGMPGRTVGGHGGRGGAGRAATAMPLGSSSFEDQQQYGPRRALAPGGSLPALPNAPSTHGGRDTRGSMRSMESAGMSGTFRSHGMGQSRSQGRLEPLGLSPTGTGGTLAVRPLTGASPSTSPTESMFHGGGMSQGSMGLASLGSTTATQQQARKHPPPAGGHQGQRGPRKAGARGGSGRPKPSPFSQIQHLPGDKPVDPSKARARRQAASKGSKRASDASKGSSTKPARANARSQVLPLTTKYGEQYDPQAATATGRGAGMSRGKPRNSGGQDGQDAAAHSDFLSKMRETVSSQQAMADRADALAEVLGYEKTQDEAARRIQQGLAARGRGKEAAQATGAAREGDWRDERERISDAFRQREAQQGEAREQELRGMAAEQEVKERARRAADVAAGHQPRPTPLERELRREDQKKEILEQEAEERARSAAQQKRVEQQQREIGRKLDAGEVARADVDAEEDAVKRGDGGVQAEAPPSGDQGSGKMPPGGPWLPDSGPGRVHVPKSVGGVLAIASRDEVIGRHVRNAASEGLPADQDGIGGVAREQLAKVGAEPEGKEQAAWSKVPVFPTLPSQRRVVSVLRRCIPGEFKPSEEDRRRARVAQRREQQGMAVEPWELDERAGGGFVVVRRDLWTGAVWRSFWREGAIVDCGPAEMAKAQAMKEAAARANEDPRGDEALAAILGQEGKDSSAAEAAAEALELPALLPSDPLLIAGSRRLQQWGGSALVEATAGESEAAPLPAQTMMAVGRASASSAVVQVDESLGTSTSPLPGHWGAVVAHSVCCAPATEEAARAAGVRRELCMVTVEVLPPDQSDNEGGGKGRTGESSLRVGFSPHASATAVERLSRSVDRPRFCLRVLGLESGTVEVTYPLTLAELFRQPRLAGGAAAVHEDPGGRSARVLAEMGLQRAQAKALRHAEEEARARATRVARARGDESPDEEEVRVPEERMQEIQEASRRSPHAALLALAEGTRGGGSVPAPASGWQLWTGVLSPVRRFGAVLLVKGATEGEVVTLFPERNPGAAHSGWESMEGGAASGAGASAPPVGSIEVGGITVSRPKLASLRAAAQAMGLDLGSLARSEDLEALEDEEAAEAAKEAEARARAEAADASPSAGDRAVAALSDSLHAAGTLAARVLLHRGTQFQYASVKVSDTPQPMLSLQVRQSSSNVGVSGAAGEEGAAGVVPPGVATLAMPLSWTEAADPSHNPLLRRAAFELAEGFGFPTSVRPDGATAVEDAVRRARAREQQLLVQLGVAEEAGDAQRAKRLEQDLKEAREQLTSPNVASDRLPTAVPVACAVRALPAGVMLFGAYLCVPPGVQEPAAASRLATRDSAGDPGKAAGASGSEEDSTRLVVVVARLPSSEKSAAGGGRMSERSQRPVRLVLDLQRARDARVNPLLERAKPHVTGVRRETSKEAEVRKQREADAAAAAGVGQATAQAGNKAAAVALGSGGDGGAEGKS